MERILIQKYMTYGASYNANISVKDNPSHDYILNKMISAVKVPHDEYESVKLYASGDFIMKLLKYIINNSKYSYLNICSIDLAVSNYDFAVNDEFVFIIDKDFNINVQNAWNGDKPFLNEAKFAIVTCMCSDEIMHNIFLDEIPIMIICS